MTAAEVAASKIQIRQQLNGRSELWLAANEYGKQFLEFTRFYQTPYAVGHFSLGTVNAKMRAMTILVSVHIMLSAWLCTPNIDEYLEGLDELLDLLTGALWINLIIEIVSHFPEPPFCLL
jgi:hypothetical protein